MPVTPLDWTWPFCGMALPAGCPWVPRPHRQPPLQAAWLLLQPLHHGQQHRLLSASRRPRPTPPAAAAPTAAAAAPVAAPPVPAPPSRETRSQTASLPPPIQQYSFTAGSTTLASPLPANSRAAMADPNWRAAMTDEYKALIDNGT
ncbi:sal-like protein 3 [Sorghum bicolor]|uniref:sal-like protein 3 n=1 Tax=Sorghum bicolor TaxID=4558 RepID=UPI000B4267E5|nr:sal-like protein 3 [Sorghum bicolor]|eukprot:XP_021305516.1 sal-like protein 3 [Sorghum bicolor]